MVEYIDSAHIYLNDKGVIIPSVSQLIDFELGNEYKDVPPFILQKAAEYGTRIHDMIQKYEENEELSLNPYSDKEVQVLKDYIQLKKQCDWKVKSMEQIVDYQGRYAGRYDMLCEDGIYDIKTTSKLMVDHLEIQLGLYMLAMGLENIKAYCLWLPKNNLVQRVEIKPWTKEQCIDLLERYERTNRI